MKTRLPIALLSLSAAMSAQTRPNILWLTFEDTSPQFIGCYGNKQAHTPNIDKLASKGVRFDAAFSSSAVSSPSRFCLITGLRAASMGTGNHRSRYAIPENIKGFPFYLREAGYYTSNNAKTDYNIANAEAFTAEAWNECSNQAGWWKRKPGQPFFAVFNSVSSHQSRTMTNSWNDYEKQVLSKLSESETLQPGTLEMPDFYRNSPEMQKNISRVYNGISLTDKEFGQLLAHLEKDGLKDSTIVFCFSDHGEGISRSKGSSLASGYKVSFVAWFPPIYKHLSPWGSGVITDEVVSFDDFAPTMLKLCGVKLQEYMKGRIFAGKQPDKPKKYVFPAIDRTDESSELSRSVSDGRYIYTKVFMPFQPFMRWNMYYDVSDLQQQIRADYSAGLLNDKQKWILEPREGEYLFDMKNDKWEITNLIKNSSLKDKASELRDVLKSELIRARDAHFMTEYAFTLTEKPPVALAADDKEYPIQRIINSAMMVGEGRNVLKQQLKSLSDDNKYIRYWASVGLFSQPSGILQSQKREVQKQLLKQFATETFEPNRINLAVLLLKMDSKQIDVAQKLLTEQNPELLRMLLHLLITLDDSQQKLLLNDIDKLYNKTKDAKKMSHCNDLMKLFLHKNIGTEILPKDDQ